MNTEMRQKEMKTFLRLKQCQTLVLAIVKEEIYYAGHILVATKFMQKLSQYDGNPKTVHSEDIP